MEGMEISVGWETIFLFTKMDVMLGWLKKLPIQTSKKQFDWSETQVLHILAASANHRLQQLEFVARDWSFLSPHLVVAMTSLPSIWKMIGETYEIIVPAASLKKVKDALVLQDDWCISLGDDAI